MQHWWRARNETGQTGMIPESYVVKDGIEGREWYVTLVAYVTMVVTMVAYGY